MKRSVQLFFLEFVGYFIVTLNMKSVADVNYLMTFVTDVMIALIGFTSVRMIVEATTTREKIAYILGAALGAQVALRFSHYVM